MFKPIWKLKIPPNIKHFWWRTLHNALPVAENLRSRGLRIDGVCQVCGDSEETLHHMLFNCKVAAKVWDHSPLRFKPGNQLFNTLHRLLDFDMSRANDQITVFLYSHFLVGEYGKFGISL